MAVALDHGDRLAGLERLAAVQSRLYAADELPDLLAEAADAARSALGFRRGVILLIAQGALTAAGTRVLADVASEELRRALVARALRLRHASLESQLILAREGARLEPANGRSVLAAALGLEEFAIAVIALESRAQALLVMDRLEPPVDHDERAVLTAYVTVLEASIERLLLRRRLVQLSRELRHLTVSAQALVNEARGAPLSFDLEGGELPELPLLAMLDPAGEPSARNRLTDREIEVAALLAEGRSNREIAGQLIVSPETVKAHVARLIRKLGASNRAEVVARYLQLPDARRSGVLIVSKSFDRSRGAR
jgi:DNA-binding CsgD family transcriptional regulator